MSLGASWPSVRVIVTSPIALKCHSLSRAQNGKEGESCPALGARESKFRLRNGTGAGRRRFWRLDPLTNERGDRDEEPDRMGMRELIGYLSILLLLALALVGLVQLARARAANKRRMRGHRPR
jgi:hypothetical protein